MTAAWPRLLLCGLTTVLTVSIFFLSVDAVQDAVAYRTIELGMHPDDVRSVLGVESTVDMPSLSEPAYGLYWGRSRSGAVICVYFSDGLAVYKEFAHSWSGTFREGAMP